MQKVDLPTSFTKLNENCGLPDFFTDYQIRHLGNPSGLPEILLKIDPCKTPLSCRLRGSSRMKLILLQCKALAIFNWVSGCLCNSADQRILTILVNLL